MKIPNEDLRYLEWQQARVTIQQFDKMVLAIRKYGFSFISILLTANGFLLGAMPPSAGVIAGIEAALLVLIFSLFRLDRMHEIFVRAAVLRAMRLEEELGMGLTRTISYWSATSITATWGTTLYVLFSTAAFLLCSVAIATSSDGVFSWVMMAVCLLSWVVAFVFILKYHRDTKLKDPDPRPNNDPFESHIRDTSQLWSKLPTTG